MNKDIKSLYIHIPFCESICDYCDFTKLQYFRNMAMQYLSSLKEEIKMYNIHQNLETIYIGGGTPTCLDDDLFEDLLKMVLPYTNNVVEYTVEANPESLSEIKLQLMRKYGVNRLSIGVETTDDKILSSLHRHHKFSDVETAIKLARNYGFSNINLDLIIGLPHVSKQKFKKDLDNILKLNPEHISCYALTVHEHTKFYINKINEPEENFVRDLYDYCAQYLKEKGYTHYEISNWAKKDRYSKHNLTYWKNEEYYGVGLGASGYVNGYRYTNTKNLTNYCAHNYIEEKEYVTPKEKEEYYIILNLRTMFGINLKAYFGQFNKDFYIEHKKTLDMYIDGGFLVYNQREQVIYPSYEGMMILDKIILDLI